MNVSSACMPVWKNCGLDGENGSSFHTRAEIVPAPADILEQKKMYTRFTYRRSVCDDVSCSRFPHGPQLYYGC